MTPGERWRRNAIRGHCTSAMLYTSSGRADMREMYVTSLMALLAGVGDGGDTVGAGDGDPS